MASESEGTDLNRMLNAAIDVARFNDDRAILYHRAMELMKVTIEGALTCIKHGRQQAAVKMMEDGLKDIEVNIGHEETRLATRGIARREHGPQDGEVAQTTSGGHGRDSPPPGEEVSHPQGAIGVGPTGGESGQGNDGEGQ